MATTSAYQWVNAMVAATAHEPLATDAIWKSLDRYAGRDGNAEARLKDVLACISVEMADHAEGPLPGLWVRVADYLSVRARRAA